MSTKKALEEGSKVQQKKRDGDVENSDLPVRLLLKCQRRLCERVGVSSVSEPEAWHPEPLIAEWRKLAADTQTSGNRVP